MMGFDPMSLDYIRLAHEAGLGVGDPQRHRDRRRRRRGAGELELPRRQEPGARRRRRPDLVRPAQALPEAVLPHAAGQRLHPRPATSITTSTAGRWSTARCSSAGARPPPGARCSCATPSPGRRACRSTRSCRRSTPPFRPRPESTDIAGLQHRRIAEGTATKEPCSLHSICNSAMLEILQLL